MLQVKSDADALKLVAGIEPWINSFSEPLAHLLTKPCERVEANAFAIAGFETARRQATIARWTAGAGAWRKWATEMSAASARLPPHSAPSRLLSWLAVADFSGHSFTQAVDFSTLPLPGGAAFACATFADETWFSDVQFNGRVNFVGAQFLRAVCFENTCFPSDADFRNSVFLRTARFSSLNAQGSLIFRGAQFRQDVCLHHSQFSGPLEFAHARIDGEAGFGNCLYQDVDFSDAVFADNAGFERSHFAGKVSFVRASFRRRASFAGCSFREKPDFVAARFFGSQHFDGLSMPALRSPIASQIEAIERGLRQS